MGQVYAARDTRSHREVAIKVLWAADAQRLIEEGRVLASIEHPRVVRVHAVDVARSWPFVVMERVHGSSLADELAARTPQPRDRALHILRGVAEALDAIHAVGRAHGDLKPENVLIERGTERVVVTDVGLARAATAHASFHGGTPAYLASERARGERPRPDLMPREDVYSLAVMAFELLTGSRPFESSDPYELLRLHAVCPPPRPSVIEPDLPWRVDHALLAGLTKRPEARHPSAAAFVEHLARAFAAEGGPRILVAEDDVDLARLLSVRLAKRLPDCFVRTVACGRSAYELMLEEPFDALITDVDMPGMNGFELLGSLRDELALAPLPRVVMSGQLAPRDYPVFDRLGVTACFQKPLDVDALAELLRDALHLARPAPKSSGVIRRVRERDGAASAAGDRRKAE